MDNFMTALSSVRPKRPEIIASGTPYKDWLRCNRMRYWGHEAISGEICPCGCPRDDHWIGADGDDIRNCKNALTCKCERPSTPPTPWRPVVARGWERVKMAIPLSTGGWCHRIAQGLLLLQTAFNEEVPASVSSGLPDAWESWGRDLGCPAPRNASEVILACSEGYLAEVRERGLDAEGTPLDETMVAQEQAALLEAFGWAFERIEVPRMLAEYEIVSIEREEFTLLSGDVGLAGRVDAVLRRRADGHLFTWNLKTVNQPDERWRSSFEVDQQIMLEGLAVERRLNERVWGCLITGFIKGPRVDADDDLKEVRGGKEPTQRITRNRLLYGYKLDANPPIQKADYDWEGTTRKGWHKFRVWEEPFMSIEALAQQVVTATQYWVNWLPEEVIAAQFIQLEPIIRSDRAVESFTRQLVAQERAIRDYRQTLEPIPPHQDDRWAAALDGFFPQDFHSCHYPGKCWAFDLCHTSGVADDPAGSGLFQPRTPNHPQGDE